MSLLKWCGVSVLLILGIANVAYAEVERLETPSLQLAQAAQLRRLIRKSTGPARVRARLEAAEAYEAVSRHHPRAVQACAEALFRAAELRRTAGQLEEACLLFNRAARASRTSPFRVRAWLELGHTCRRQKRQRDALASYDRTLRERSGSPKYRDQALFWKARTLLDMERTEEARELFRQLAEGVEDPVMCVRAYDELVLLAIEANDLEWAAGVLEQCRKALSGPLAQETHVGRRVRSAFRRMRCRARLRDAVVKRNTPSTGCARTPSGAVLVPVRDTQRISA